MGADGAGGGGRLAAGVPTGGAAASCGLSVGRARGSAVPWQEVQVMADDVDRAVHVGGGVDGGRGVAGVAGARRRCSVRVRAPPAGRRGRSCRRAWVAPPVQVGRRGWRRRQRRRRGSSWCRSAPVQVGRRRRRCGRACPRSMSTVPVAWACSVGTTWHSVQAMAAERSRVFTRWAWWAPTARVVVTVSPLVPAGGAAGSWGLSGGGGAGRECRGRRCRSCPTCRPRRSCGWPC